MNKFMDEERTWRREMLIGAEKYLRRENPAGV